MKIICISTVPASALAEAVKELKDGFELSIDFKIYYPNQIDEEIDEEIVKEDLVSSDAVLIDIRGGGRSSEVVYDALKDEEKIILNLVAPVGKLMSITRLGSFLGRRIADKIVAPGEVRDPENLWKKIKHAQRVVETGGRILPLRSMRDASNYVKITRYWRYGGKENYRNMLILLLREYLGYDLPKAKEPVEFPEYGIYHPEYGYFTDLESFLERSGFVEDRPTIGILFYGGMHFDQSISTVISFIKEFEEFNLIPVYADGVHNLTAMRRYFLKMDQPIVDAIINLTWFRLNGGPLGGDHELTRELLMRLNVPVFAPAPMFMRDIDRWRESPTGLSPIEVITAVIWPELDGCIEPIPSCGVQNIRIGELDAKEVVPIDDRISRIAGRIRRWIKLRNMPNHEKRIGIIIYNYPPGEKNIGKAGYLDTFRSLKRLLEHLKEDGYEVELPDTDLRELFEKMAIVNSGTWLRKERTLENCRSLDVKEYIEFFGQLHDSMQSDIMETWGTPPGQVMALSDKILIPGIELGNVFVGIQPARPPLGDADLAEASHDKTKPPHHQYLAFYYWLREIWGADAVIHVGTHGLAEFMKGKEVGLSSNCFPDLLIGDMPNLYIYHILNTSEVVIAKRRLYGTMIGHNSPPYTTSELYDEYSELQDLIDEYSEAAVQDPPRCKRVREKILDRAEKLNFKGEDIDHIHEELYEMRRRIIPKGLHIIGEEYEGEDLKRFIEFMLRYDRDDTKSLNRILAESMNIDYDSVLRNRDKFASGLEEIDERCAMLVDRSIEGSIEAALERSNLPTKHRNDLRDTLEYGMNLMRRYSQNDAEIGGCLRGLGGKFIEQGGGGDIIRSPDILPTGRNLTQFDPNRIPTQTAFDRGAEIADNTISRYLERDGVYPESVGVILWGFETTKTGGESIGQILHYLGVRIVRETGTWDPELVVRSLEELDRPRIDCLVNICGFFRDMFPNIMQLLDRAFNLVAELDEPTKMNYVRKHSLENLKMLKDEPHEKTAIKTANGRIFGPRAGEYGTRMLPLIEDSIWRNEEDLAEVFIQSMNHLYAENIHATKSDDVYRMNLARVEMVSQVRDSHDYEMIDLDHYYEFFGGLSNAVKAARGKRPEMLVTDTTGELIETECARDVITRGARTRLLNPKWTEGMLKHDFHGTQQISDRVENMLGLAATTGSVDNWIWSSIAERYVFDDNIRDKLIENNRFAAAEIMERLFEAERRGYWDATDGVLEKLRKIYLDLEGKIEETL